VPGTLRSAFDDQRLPDQPIRRLHHRHLDFESNFPVQDIIEEETESDDAAKAAALPVPLITMRDIDALTGEPLLDDPVTGSGNDDLWTAPTE
jgi:hypothetical protein